MRRFPVTHLRISTVSTSNLSAVQLGRSQPSHYDVSFQLISLEGSDVERRWAEKATPLPRKWLYELLYVATYLARL